MYQYSFQHICIIIIVFNSLASWLVLTGIKLNYGRLRHSVAKIYINPKIGWFLFQVPNLLWAGYFLLIKGDSLSLALALFIVHYVNRDIVYPLRMKSTTSMPFQILIFSILFTTANGYLQCIANQQQRETHSLIRQSFGIIIFTIGLMINIYSDSILQKVKEKLKKQGQKKYTRIDQFLFKWIGNPNYFGEIIEWIGYSIVSGHAYAWLFAYATINILIPAALARNKWNKTNIDNYPLQRKAILPFLL